MNFDFDLKHNKLELLSETFIQEHLDAKGVFQIQRQIPLVSKDELLNIASYDIAQIESLFSEGVITYASMVGDQEGTIISITLRLSNRSILKYVTVSNDYFEPRLRLNFSLPGRVFEYDDEKKYLSSTTEIKKKSQLDQRYPYAEVRKRIDSLLEVKHD